MDRTRLVRSCTAVIAVVLLAAGCHRGDQPQPTTSSPADGLDKYKPNVSGRWIANPAIDLMSPEGTFIRAAFESWERADHSLRRDVDTVDAGGYPGFVRALGNSISPALVTGGAGGGWAGTIYYEVVSFRQEGNQFVAGVCYYLSALSQNSLGRYERGGPPNSTGHWFTFGPDPAVAPDQQHEPPANQKGPALRPSGNVFGTWVITKIDLVTDKTLPQCHNKYAPGVPADRPDKYLSADPAPVLPPDPGWPEAGSA
ncbi:hypothetical protein [Mycobacteroides abscessus]|uniref:hypothetical protein n=1 Tax=Mycobacteroides abscessus TaxID=36809 RepID=UPI00266D5C40|nr:hypothetical protein [Mycobacteroides abscessus]MDO3058017.1 hypothetical protein [Mycobacteroides abscessus subsp. abscessus]MDO3276316.1 hypothetical protein [Mycobacteroides abscessus subsp. abscessus]